MKLSAPSARCAAPSVWKRCILGACAALALCGPAGAGTMPHYSSYQEVGEKLAALAAAHPGEAERVSLGQSSEGREIWALHVHPGQTPASQRPGVVITGVHHAREWMTLEIPLALADQLLNDPAARARTEKTDLWIVPLVNPDGYEYSRTVDPQWRKNRHELAHPVCGDAPAIGVDLNRNYGDAGHPELYRAAGEAPCAPDGASRTSNRAASELFRGESAASEPETRALLNLELGKPNIRGVIDLHSYGKNILYPYATGDRVPERLDDYLTIGRQMRRALDGTYKLEQASEFYRCFGISNDVQDANGILGFTLEVGTSFQPPPEEIAATSAQINKANLVFIDAIAARGLKR